MYKITMTKKRYSRTDSGKSWRSKPDREEVKEVTQEEHHNITSKDTRSFFRRLGGSEYIERSYTPAGYNITWLTSIDPSKNTKVVRTFQFEYKE